MSGFKQRSVLSVVLLGAVFLLRIGAASASILDDKGADDPNYKMAAQMAEKGNFPVAKALLDTALKQHPDSIAVLTASAQLAQKQDRKDDAVKYAKEVLRLEIKQRNLVEALRKAVTGDKREALATRDRRIAAAQNVLKELEPGTELIYRKLSELLAESEPLRAPAQSQVEEFAHTALNRLLAPPAAPAGAKGPVEEKPAAPTKRRYIITIKAFVDADSTLVLKDGEVFWENSSHSVPGKHGGVDEPTYVNGRAWRPVWPGGGLNGGKLKSDPVRSNTIHVPTRVTSVRILARKGRGTIAAAAGTDGEVKVRFTDPDGGASWYEVRLLVEGTD